MLFNTTNSVTADRCSIESEHAGNKALTIAFACNKMEIQGIWNN